MNSPHALVSRLRNLRPLVWPLAAATLGFLLSFILFSPGFLDNDTLGQMIQAQNNFYHEWHPPLLAYTWHWLLKVLPNTWGLFLFDSLAFWFGLALLLNAFLPSRPKTAALLVLFFGMNPAFFAVNALVWKDAVFAVAMLLAVALLVVWQRRKSVTLLLASGVLMFFASGVRHNGLFAAYPLYLWMIHVALPRLRIQWQGLVAVLLGLLLAVGEHRVSRWITAGDNGFAEQVVLSFDMAGTSVRAKENLYPPSVKLSLSDIEKIYRPYSVLPLFWEDELTRGLRRPGFISSSSQAEWYAAWIRGMYHHPGAYLAHRAEFTKYFLGIGIGPERGYIFFPANNVPQNPSFARSDRLTAGLVGWIRQHEHDFPFRTYMYFFPLCFLAAYFARHWRTHLFEAALAASGMFYAISFFIAGVAADFRYAFWIAIVTCTLFARYVFIAACADGVKVQDRSAPETTIPTPMPASPISVLQTFSQDQ